MICWLDLFLAERLRQQAWEIVIHIADHTGSEELRASFLALPEVNEVNYLVYDAQQEVIVRWQS